MKTRKLLFQAFTLMVIFTMAFGSPMNVRTVQAAPGDSSVNYTAVPYTIDQLMALDAKAGGTTCDAGAGLVRLPSLGSTAGWHVFASTVNPAGLAAPLNDGSGNADVIYNVSCMQESAGFNLNCTANDISIAKATNIKILDDGCAFPGDTVSFEADFEVLLTAQARYDVGLWFASDGDPNGDAAKTGTCTAATPAFAPDPPWLDLDQAVTGQADDTCGDIDAAHNPLYPSVTLTVVCADDDANGKLDLPNCTSWRQPGDNSLCTSPVQAVPGAPSKCKCDTGFNIDIPVPGQIIVDKVTDPTGLSTSFDFTLTGTPTDKPAITPVTFSLTDASTPFKSSFLYAGTYSVAETANSSYSTTATCDDGSPANAVVLSPGEIVTCTFTNKLLTGTLIVNKTLVNDNSGTKTCPDFSYSVDSGTAVPFESDCSNSVTVLAGSHTVVEAGVPIDGYSTTYNNCTNVSVPAGGSATCTITNDDVAVPGMTVDKSSTTTTLSAPGTVTYDYLVTNTGNTSLTGITLSDNNDNDDMTCPATTLAKGETMTCHATHTFTQAELDAGGTLDNTVTADSNETEPATDSLSIPITKNAAIIVVKASTTVEVVEAGQVVPYTFTVDNEGNVTLTGITVSDPKCDAAPAYVSGDANGDGKLQVDETWIYSCDHTVTQAEIDSNGGGDGDLDNTVTADSTESEPDTDDHAIPIDYNPAMTVDKSSVTTSLSAPATVTYDYLVTNTGNVTLTGIALSDNNDNDDMVCESDTLAVGESMTCTATHTFTQAELDAGGSLDNTVTADSNETEPVTDSLSIPITTNAAIIVVKASTTEVIVNAGQVVPYTFTVNNEGNVTLTGITVSDPKCDAAPVYQSGDDGDGKLQVSETWIYTCDHTVTQAEIDTDGGGDGDLDNTVTADSTESAPDTDDYQILIYYNPVMTVEKSSTTTSLSAPGTVTYDYLVSNTGNVTLTGIVLSDNNDNDDLVCPADTLAVGASMTCHATHTFTQAELDAGGSLYNVVTVDSDQTDPVTDDLTIPISQTASLSLAKTGTFDAGADGYADVGDLISYEFVVSNTGNLTLTGITVTDPKVSNISCPADTLAVGANMTCTGTYAVTQADIDAGSVYNLATADSNESGPDDDDETIPLPQHPLLWINKVATEETYAAVGDTLHYTITATNIGNVTLKAVTVSDPLVDDLTCVPANGSDLAPGASMVCTATHTVSQADIDAGHWGNTACVDDGEGGAPNICAEEDVPGTKTPHLTLTKTATETTFDSVDDILNYTIVATNDGNTTLASVTVSDPSVDGLTCMPANGSSLAPGESMTCTATHTVSQADIDAGHWANNACVDDGPEGAPEACDDEDVPGTQNPLLSITKVATEESFNAAGDILHYTIEVKNIGNTTLQAVTVTDPSVSNLVCVPENGSTLVPSGTMTCTATHTVTQADLDAGGWANQACVDDGLEGAPQVCDDQNVPGDQNPALTLDKAVTSAEPYDSVGDVITYSLVATNTGNVTLHDVSISDPKLGTLTCTQPVDLAPLATLTCTASHTITQADIDAGSFYNIATADSTETEPVTDDVTVPMTQNPALSLVKTGTFDAGADGYADIGELISYEFLVTNEGNVTLTGITVTDPKVSPISCPADTLAVGASMTCTGTYAVTQADIDTGFVYNLATADSNESEPDDGDNNEPLPQNPAVEVMKTADPTSVPETGADVTFTFKVSNIGNVTLTITSLDDSVYGPLAGDADCAIGTVLAVGSSCEFAVTHWVEGDFSGPAHVNTFTAHAEDNGGQDASDDDDATVDFADVLPDITITKSADPTHVLETGGDVTFTFLVENVGPEDVTLTSLTDTVFGDLNGQGNCATGGSIPVGGSYTCSITQSLASDSLTAHYNVVTAVGTDNDGSTDEATDDETITFDDVAPAILVTKSASPTHVPETGGDVTFTFLVENVGVEDVTLTSLSDTVFGDLNGKGDCAVPQTILIGGSYSCSYTVKLSSDLLTDHYNVTTATAVDDDNTPATDDDDETVTFDDVLPDISLLKTANPTSVPETGGDVVFTFKVTNNGAEAVAITSLTDSIFGPLAGDADCMVGTSLASSASCEFSLTKMVAGDYEGGISHVNTATVVASDNDGNDDTATDDATVEFTDVTPDMDVEKYVSIDGGTTWVDADAVTGPYLNSGTAPQFKFVVTNTGNVALSSVSVTDSDFTLPAGCIAATLAVGASDDCIITGTWAAGQHTNTATASGSFTDGAGNTESDTDTDDANYFGADPKIDLTKTGAWVDGNADGYAQAGETINYSFVVKNIGNVTLSNVTVTDPKVSPISCPETTLAVNESMTCTGSYTLTLADIYAGKVDNTATAYGSFTDDTNNTKTVNDPSSATVTLPLKPTGMILPTQTSCQQYRDGTYKTMPQYYPPYGYVYYGLKGKLINNINPGVFFYYSEVSLAGGEFSIDVSQSNDKAWPKIPTQVGDNILLWDASCTKVQDLTAAYDPATGNATISGSVPAGVYYISVKWAPSSPYDKTTNNGLVGYAPTGKPMVTYSFQAYLKDSSYDGIIAASGAKQILAPKK